METGTLIQYFHWYYPGDGSLWRKFIADAPKLSELGITAVWFPPAFKGNSGGMSVGYDVYDIYDLGEFDQKGSVRTKYGTRQEYTDAIKAAHAAGIKVYVDIAINHLAGADEAEKIQVHKVNPDNRNEVISDTFEIEAFTKFTFPGRKGKYSHFIWDKNCFTGVDYAYDKQESGIYKILNDYGDRWDDVIDEEKGNYDYLMYADVEFRNPYVQEELKRWAEWYWRQTGFDGVRLDAVKHISPAFFNDWLDHLRAVKGSELFAVAEYWAPGNLPLLLRYINATAGRVSLFDASLHYNLHKASKQGKDFNMATIFDDTLVKVKPGLSVTVTDNHDTQPLQALEAPIEPWFKPIAYSLILLRSDGYPSVFYPDLFGANYTDKGSDGNDYEIHLPPCDGIEKLLLARKIFASGEQHDYFDHGNCAGWTREGNKNQPKSGCAVLLSTGDKGFKKMYIGKQHAGNVFKDYLDKIQEEVIIDEEGHGAFSCPAGQVSVWVKK